MSDTTNRRAKIDHSKILKPKRRVFFLHFFFFGKNGSFSHTVWGGVPILKLKVIEKKVLVGWIPLLLYKTYKSTI